MKKILSIIVPTYNMESLLQADLQSLVLDENLLTKIEVLVINDGSKDRSSDIAHEFEAKYPESFIVIDKENGNYGSCINVGLKKAKGRYIKILDADDSLDSQVFAGFIKELEHVDADIVFNDYAKTYALGRIKDYIFDLPVRQELSIEDVINNAALRLIQLPSITYRKAIFDGLDYHQTEGISYTDMEWCFLPVINAKTVYYIPGRLYLYFMGREGQTMDPKVFKKGIGDRVQVLINMIKCESKLDLNDFTKRFLDNQLLRHIVYVYCFYLIDSPETDRTKFVEFDEALRQLNPDVYQKSGLFEYRKRISYKFVAEWREKRYKRVPLHIRMYERVLDFIGSRHAKMLRAVNED